MEVQIYRNQLQTKEIIRMALDMHFEGRETPKVIQELIIRQRNFYHRKHIGGAAAAAGEKNHEFFTIAQSATEPFASNFVQVIQPSDRFFVIAGIQLQVATGAAEGTDAEDTLDYGVPYEGEILNGKLNLEVNDVEVFKDIQPGAAFINDESIPGYFPLSKLIVWEPDQQINLELKLADSFAAATYKYAKFTLWGWELSK